MAWRRFCRAETGVFLGIWLGLMLLGRSSLLRDPGTFWHIRVGQEILASGHVIHTDTFSFTRDGEPWVAHQWLAECGMALVYRFCGLDGLLLVTVTLLAGLYTWLAGRMLRAGLHMLAVGVVLALVLLASSHQFHIRPLIVSIVLLGVTFALLVDVEAGRKSLRWLWLLVPLTALWANLHPGVLAGFGTLGLVAMGWSIDWLLGRDSPIRRARDLLVLAALLLACGLMLVAGPYAFELPRAWLKTLTMPLPSLIQEHRPLELADPLGWTVIALGLGYGLALFGMMPRWLRPTWLIPLVWLILAVTRVRNVPLFAIVTAIAAVELIPHGRWAEWLRRREWLAPPAEDTSVGPHKRAWPAAIAPVLLVVITAMLQVAGVRVPVIGSGWARLDPAHCPVELLPDLESLSNDNFDNTPIFNDLAFGGLVIHYAPRLRVFIDDRCALYGTEFLQQYDHARTSDPAQFDRWQKHYGFQYALVETGMPFDRYLANSGRWTVIKRTPVAVLYRRIPTRQSTGILERPL